MARTRQVAVSWVEITENQLLDITKYVFGLNSNTNDRPTVELKFADEGDEDFRSVDELKDYLQGLDFEGYKRLQGITIMTPFGSDPRVRVDFELGNDPFVKGVIATVRASDRDVAKTICEKLKGYLNKRKTYNWLLGNIVFSGVAGFLLVSPLFFLKAKYLPDDYSLLFGTVIGTVLVAPFSFKLRSLYGKLVVSGSGRVVKDDWVRLVAAVILPLIINVLTNFLPSGN